ncbi:MAG TPA: hypothetical protein VGL91_12680, partial [Acidobacteriota bacterium]
RSREVILGVVLTIAMFIPVAFSQSQKRSGTQAKASQKNGSRKLSREFTKSALLTKTTWDQVLSSIERGDPESRIQRYKDDAERSSAVLKADVQTFGDAGAHLCMTKYETSVVHAESAIAMSALTHSSGNEASAFSEADDAGRVVDSILSAGSYSNQCN